jgi:pimeloyl-ACP methyl ester carboxylesterase
MGYSAVASKFVSSSDGSRIYAEAVGNPSNPAIVFVAGFTMSSIVFEKQFEDEALLSKLYMVS